MAAAKQRFADDRRRDLFVAWQTAAFVGAAFVGKLPEWRAVIERTTEAEQSFEQMKAQLTAISQATGIPLRQVNGGR